jgi:4-aminobutyrate aminotransferase-like enzyme
VRAVGLLGALELVRDRDTREPDPEAASRVFRAAMHAGLKLCLGGCVLRLSPPLNLTSDELDEGFTLLGAALATVREGRDAGGAR